MCKTVTAACYGLPLISPSVSSPRTSDVRFYAHKAEFRRTDHEIELTMEIAVAPDDDVEIRRITLHNRGERPRRLALTSYGEVVMAAPRPMVVTRPSTSSSSRANICPSWMHCFSAAGRGPRARPRSSWRIWRSPPAIPRRGRAANSRQA